jgi:hypothetical protein
VAAGNVFQDFDKMDTYLELAISIPCGGRNYVTLLCRYIQLNYYTWEYYFLLLHCCKALSYFFCVCVYMLQDLPKNTHSVILFLISHPDFAIINYISMLVSISFLCLFSHYNLLQTVFVFA